MFFGKASHRANTVSYDFLFSSQLTSTVILKLTCAVGQMMSMTIMTGSTTRAVLLQLVRAPRQITPQENTVGIEAQHLVIIPFVNTPFARLGCTVENQS